MAKDFGAEALKASIENSSQIGRLEERVKDLERELKRIAALLAPKGEKKTMSRELALASKRRAMSQAMEHRWAKPEPPEPAPKRRKKKGRAT